MPSYNSKLFNIDPYYDDFDETKNYHKILFRPGYAVQARELTQLQSILQNQVERFGNHVFRDGSKVYGAESAVQTVNYVRVTTTADMSSFIGFDVTISVTDGSPSTVTAKVIHAEDEDATSDPKSSVLFVQIVKGDIDTLVEGTVLVSSNPTLETATVVSTGMAKLFSVNDGIFYVDGYFVKSGIQYYPGFSGEANTTTREFNSTSWGYPTGVFGFDVTPDYVGSNEDLSLTDPARGTYNHNAPGADRYKLSLDLKFYESTERDNFLPLATMNSNGTITNQVLKSDYSEIEKTLARRTYDESGSYIVDPFEIETIAHTGSSADHVSLAVGSGKGYILGYEFENQSTEYIDAPRARTTESNTLKTIESSELGNRFTLTLNDDVPSPFFTTLLENNSGVESPVSVNLYRSTLALGEDLPDENTEFEDYVTQVATADLIAFQNSSLGSFTSNEHLLMNFYLADIQFLNKPENQQETYDLELNNDIGNNLMLGLSPTQIIASGSVTGVYGRDESSSLVFSVNEGTAVKTINDLKVRTKKVIPLSLSQNESTGFFSSTVDLDAFMDAGYFDFVGTNGVLANDEKMIYHQIFRTETRLITNPAAGEEGEPENISVTSRRLLSPSEYSVNKTLNSLNINFFAEETDAGTLGGSPNWGNSQHVLVSTVEFSMPENDSNYTNAIKRKSLQTATDLSVTSSDVSSEGGRSFIKLNHADVLKIKSITNSDGTSVIDDFLFDNGQRDHSYEFGRLYFLKSKEDSYKVSGQFNFTLDVTYDYFEHTSSNSPYGFLTVDSYPIDNSSFSYEDIPLFTSQSTGKTVSLASCIDFRPIKNYDRSTDTQELTRPSLGSCPVLKVNRVLDADQSSTATRSNDNIRVAHEYYLPRTDKLVLKRNFNDETSTFELIQGAPSLSPEAPQDRDNSLSLYKLTFPPYTHNPKDINVESLSNKRYTMDDIGEVDKRLEKIEILSSLSSVEAKVDAKYFVNRKQASVGEAEKRAILVDDFNGHSIADVSNDDYRCAIDFQNKELRPSFHSYNYDLSASTSGVTISGDGIATIEYAADGLTLAEQTKASETISVNPYQLTNWVGTVQVDNPIDTWFDQTERPFVRSNTMGENDAWLATSYGDTKVGFGSQWNDWESIWSGVGALRKLGTKKTDALLSIPRVNENLNTMRSFFEKEQVIERSTKSVEQKAQELIPDLKSFPDHILRTLKGKAVDITVVPYMRSRTYGITVHNLKPNTTVYAFLDNTNVSGNITDADGQTVASYTTDDTGKISGLTLTIPTKKFLTGKRTLRFIDNETNTISTATTIAETPLHAQGIYETRSQGAVSVRPIIRRKQTVTSSAIPSDVVSRKEALKTSDFYQWVDPLAQTFFVDESEHSRGVFLQSLHLCFAKKDDTLPITIQIRPTKNGNPHPSAIIPFSERVVYPSDIAVDSSYPEATTRINFSSPVFLEPGEYAICFVTNSRDYELYTATIGANELSSATDTVNRIQKPVYGGNLFRPQNTNVAQPDFTKDIKFTLTRCNFSTSGIKQLTLSSPVLTSTGIKSNLLRLNSTMLTPAGTSKSITESTFLNGLSVEENTNVNIPATAISSSAGNFVVTLTNGTNEVSPVIDTSNTDVIHVQNVINNERNNNSTVGDETDPFGTDAGADVRYITKRILLPKNSKANDFDVSVDYIKPSGSQIEVFVKADQRLGGSFDSQRYIQLIRKDTEIFSESDNDVITESFHMPNIDNEYDSFAVKICLYSEDSSSVPLVKSVKAVALEHTT